MKPTINPSAANGKTVSNPGTIRIFVGECDGQIENPVEYRTRIVDDTLHVSISVKWNDIDVSGMAIVPMHDDYYTDIMLPMKSALCAAGIDYTGIAHVESDLLQPYAIIFDIVSNVCTGRWGAWKIVTIDTQDHGTWDPKNLLGVDDSDEDRT